MRSRIFIDFIHCHLHRSHSTNILEWINAYCRESKYIYLCIYTLSDTKQAGANVVKGTKTKQPLGEFCNWSCDEKGSITFQTLLLILTWVDVKHFSAILRHLEQTSLRHSSCIPGIFCLSYGRIITELESRNETLETTYCMALSRSLPFSVPQFSHL